MGKITGFLEFERQERDYEPVAERIKHWREFVLPLPEADVRKQGARCMDCGIPFCHGTVTVTGAPTGCPVNNQIPDWNDLVYRGDWREAARNLHSTNNFPEVTGRVCPAPCEASCTLNIEDNPVAIKTIECAIADRAIEQGWTVPEPPARKTGKKVAIIGSGPAGMACAQQLARAGHEVHVYEKYAKAGGLMRYGIPDFKMEKHHIDRRVTQMEAEGVVFHYNVHVGVSLPVKKLVASHDAVVLAGGAEKGRDLPIPGRELKGIHFAMDFLPQQNRRVSGEPQAQSAEPILANGRHVVVIGGGDTGSDCIGTSIRQGALSVTNFEIMPEPPERENKLKPIAGTEFDVKAELVLLAMGFVHPVHEGMISELKLELDLRGNVKADTVAYRSSNPKVFACGDMRRGQSLVVWAIREGRQAAHAVDKFLMGTTTLPR